MSAPAANLFVLQDLEDSSRTANLAARDLSALRAVANWIEIFVAKPAKELGRAGPVCPFVPRSLELKALWLAPQRIADPGAADLVQLIDCYKRLLLSAKPIDGDDAHYKAIIVVFTDLSADRAADYLGDSRIQDLKRLSYAEDGVVMGEFHPRNEGSAIRNPSFHPFKSPVPFMLMRQAVVSDWMFFLDNDDWLNLWARRFSQDVSTTALRQMRRELGRPA